MRRTKHNDSYYILHRRGIKEISFEKYFIIIEVIDIFEFYYHQFILMFLYRLVLMMISTK